MRKGREERAKEENDEPVAKKRKKRKEGRVILEL